MFNVLAMMPPHAIVLMIVAILVFILVIIPMLKKSKGVDKLADGLFNPVETNTVDDCIDSIKKGKDGLVEKSKEVANTIKDATETQTKINKNL